MDRYREISNVWERTRIDLRDSNFLFLMVFITELGNGIFSKIARHVNFAAFFTERTFVDR